MSDVTSTGGVAAQPKSRLRGRLLNILKVLVSLGLLVWLLSGLDVGEALRYLAAMRWLPFAAAMLLYLAGVLVRAYRWGLLVWALGVKVSYWRLVALYFVGSFFSQVLPTGVGGDAVKMYELQRDNRQAAAAISSVVVDRFLGLFVLFAMALPALAFGYRLVPAQVIVPIGLVLAGSVLAVALVLQRTWIEAVAGRLRLTGLLDRFKIVRELYSSIHFYGPAALLKATLASAVFNLMLILANYWLGVAVGIHQPMWVYFLFVPIISALLLVPSIGGLGIRENAYVFLFALVGVDKDHAFALSLAYDAGVFLTSLIGAIVYLVQGLREAGK